MSDFFLRNRSTGDPLFPRPFSLRAALPMGTDLVSVNRRGRMLLAQGQINQAASLYRRLLLQAQFDRQPTLTATCCENLARIHELDGQTPLAEHYRRRAMLLKEAIAGDADPESSFPAVDTAELNGRINVALNDGDLCRAEVLLWQSLTAESQHGSPADQADDLAGLGVVALLREEWVLAFELLWQACELHQLGGDDGGAGSDLMNLSQAYLQTGHLRTARWALEQATAFLAAGDEPEDTLDRSAELLREFDAADAVSLPWPVEIN